MNVFTETHKDAFNGYVALAELLTAKDDLHSTLEDDVELNDVEHEGTFKVRCFDGIALAVNDKMNVVLQYPKKETMTHEELAECLRYRGLDEKVSVLSLITSSHTTYGDIMVRFGKAIMVHYKK